MFKRIGNDHAIVSTYPSSYGSSNQGGNGGAHDGDHLGTSTVYGDLITEEDLVVDNMAFYGAFNTLDQYLDGF